jgi:hypothetical protein
MLCAFTTEKNRIQAQERLVSLGRKTLKELRARQGTRPAELESAALEFVAYILGLGLDRKRCDAFARGVVREVAQCTDGACSQGDRRLSIEGKFDQRISQWA